jgi:hypothetical protein
MVAACDFAAELEAKVSADTSVQRTLARGTADPDEKDAVLAV